MAPGITSSLSRSTMAAASRSAGQSPPKPMRCMKDPQLSQRCSPTERMPQAAHSYTVSGWRGRGTGTTVGAAGTWCRRRQAVARQACEQ
jgi:hypothetical protein